MIKLKWEDRILIRARADPLNGQSRFQYGYDRDVLRVILQDLYRFGDEQRISVRDIKERFAVLFKDEVKP